MTDTLKGRASIFRGKKNRSGKVLGMRLQGIVTKTGAAKFREHRARLAKIAKRNVRDVSHADVIEYLARGEAATIKYLEELR